VGGAAAQRTAAGEARDSLADRVGGQRGL
jgi:hypothetical protein